MEIDKPRLKPDREPLDPAEPLRREGADEPRFRPGGLPSATLETDEAPSE